MPATGYYFLAISVGIAVFFASWWLFEADTPTPWIPAGLITSLVLASLVIYREVYMRRAMSRYLIATRMFEDSWRSSMHGIGGVGMGLHQNAAILREIERKSNAARTLGHIAAPHLEVFELCEEYLSIAKREIATMASSSRRMASISRGRQKVEHLHKYHLITWAALESKEFTLEAQQSVSLGERLSAANKALAVLDSALYFYPDDSRLNESVSVVKELRISSELSSIVRAAEKAENEGDIFGAISYYKDAHYYLTSESTTTEKTSMFAEKISIKIEELKNLRQLEN